VPRRLIHAHDSTPDFRRGCVSGAGRPPPTRCGASRQRPRPRTRGEPRHRRGVRGSSPLPRFRVRTHFPGARPITPRTMDSGRACAPHQVTGEHDPHRPRAPHRRNAHGRVRTRRLRLGLGRADGPLAGPADPPHAAGTFFARGIPRLFRDPPGRIPALDLLRHRRRERLAGRAEQHRPPGRADAGSRGPAPASSLIQAAARRARRRTDPGPWPRSGRPGRPRPRR
jgi:hypothetical protein